MICGHSATNSTLMGIPYQRRESKHLPTAAHLYRPVNLLRSQMLLSKISSSNGKRSLGECSWGRMSQLLSRS